MIDGWKTNDSAVIVGESIDDEDSLVICLVDDTQAMMTAVLDRSEIESLVEYMAEWVKHWDEDGALAENGMIPMPGAERATYHEAMKNMPALTADMLK